MIVTLLLDMDEASRKKNKHLIEIETFKINCINKPQAQNLLHYNTNAPSANVLARIIAVRRVEANF